MIPGENSFGALVADAMHWQFASEGGLDDLFGKVPTLIETTTYYRTL